MAVPDLIPLHALSMQNQVKVSIREEKCSVVKKGTFSTYVKCTWRGKSQSWRYSSHHTLNSPQSLYKNQIVAIKILSRGDTHEDIANQERRFAVEVAMLSIVRHKNLVKFVGACKDLIMVIVTELLTGGTLRKYLFNMVWNVCILMVSYIAISSLDANSQTTEFPIEKHLILFQKKMFKSYQETPKSLHQVMKPMQLIEEDMDQARLEILKAVAQAWHGHTNRSSANTREADPYRNKFKGKPSRFKMERLEYHLLDKAGKGGDESAFWDFGESLWDSFEVVTVSKQLDNGLVLEQAFAKPYSRKHNVGRNGEAVNSLRFLFNHFSSRRFSEPKCT